MYPVALYLTKKNRYIYQIYPIFFTKYTTLRVIYCVFLTCLLYICENSATDWGGLKRKDCKGQVQPVVKSMYPGGQHPAEVVVERVLRKMSTPVYLLNTTTLSQLRKDGHPSIYGFGGHRSSDCSHWCLSGVPDTWNQLLYAALIQS